MVQLLEKAAECIPAERLWVNPDCGLKTRGWPETEAALVNMVAAARQLRAARAPRSPERWRCPGLVSALGGVLEGGQAFGGPAVHVLLQTCRFGGLQEQPELGSAPENVVNR